MSAASPGPASSPLEAALEQLKASALREEKSVERMWLGPVVGAAPSPGGTGRVRGKYETHYDYDRFTKEELEALRSARLHVRLGFAALLMAGFAILAWAILARFNWN